MPTEPARPERPADWEAFYANYKRPGYVPGFEITSKLGGGMFGLVFKARKQSIGKDYAIKFLKVDDGEVRRAVLAELEQVKYFAQVDHPNLVSIEDRGEADGIPYLVMAYAGAETLKDRLPGKPEDRDELLRFVLQACRGVAALHERSLVHFDLKPANVFLKGGVARVGDYGLSKLVTHSRGSLSMGRGTPYYMAPEMLQRRGDTRSDIYSLGVVLYECLCGDVPFKGDSEWEVLRKHEHEAPVFPAHVGGRERAAIARCLQKDPDQRFQSVGELIAALGSSQSAGNATWQDVRDGKIDAAAGAAPPPPKPPPQPPPGSPRPDAAAEDPYKAFGRAARDAATHAGKIARDAMANARSVARRAQIEARKAMRAARGKGRALNSEQWLAWQQRWRQRRLDRAQRRASRRLARQQRREARIARVGGAIGAAARFLAVAFVALAVFAVVLMVSRDKRGPATIASAGSGPPAPAVPDAPVAVPQPAEPTWVAMAVKDRPGATAQLRRSIERFVAKAPLELPSRQKTDLTSLPSFAPVVPRGVDAEALDSDLRTLATADKYDAVLALQLRTHERDALLKAAEILEATSLDDDESLQAARNLQRFLRETTGFDQIKWIEDANMSDEDRRAANQCLGRLWRWFLDETARTPRSWDTYRTLQKK